MPPRRTLPGASAFPTTRGATDLGEGDPNMATRFGLLVPHFGVEADQDLLIKGAQLADRLGFDSLWVRDHLVFHPHGMEGTDRTFIEPFITLTYLAGVTDKIGLGAATIIPFRHPILMAYSVPSMSCMTRRKFALGIASRTFHPH